MPAKRSTNDSWCILRTSGRHTLRLAATLAEDGFEVWTPAETKRIRIPRANVRREVTLPIMPSYIFAKAGHLVDLLQLAAKPVGDSFSVMRHGERIAMVTDESLQALRRLEAKRALTRKSVRTFEAGVEVVVKIEGGSFAGMRGKVERSDHGHTLICFDQRMTAKIPTSFLDETAVRNEPPCDQLRKAA